MDQPRGNSNHVYGDLTHAGHVVLEVGYMRYFFHPHLQHLSCFICHRAKNETDRWVSTDLNHEDLVGDDERNRPSSQGVDGHSDGECQHGDPSHTGHVVAQVLEMEVGAQRGHGQGDEGGRSDEENLEVKKYTINIER